ncbi:hypothetical protein BDV32DRAFT_129678 [Aspergillus pseudonomiae]|nr:hypothetical protein BDV32DRAFT_129678 [Aspergillus pseudonomiae]
MRSAMRAIDAALPIRGPRASPTKGMTMKTMVRILKMRSFFACFSAFSPISLMSFMLLMASASCSTGME